MKHLTTRLTMIALLAMTTAVAAADTAPSSSTYEFDPMACSKLARKWIDDPFALSMGELDSLALCARTLQAMKLQEREADEHQKAIMKLYDAPPTTAR